MKLKETLKDYDEFEGAYVISYELTLNDNTFYNIEKHETAFYGRVDIFETTKNKYHNVSIFEKLKEKINDLYEESYEDTESFMANAPDFCYSYNFTTYRDPETFEQLFNEIVKALEEINEKEGI